jgi:hypothetical protein
MTKASGRRRGAFFFLRESKGINIEHEEDQNGGEGFRKDHEKD